MIWNKDASGEPRYLLLSLLLSHNTRPFSDWDQVLAGNYGEWSSKSALVKSEAKADTSTLISGKPRCWKKSGPPSSYKMAHAPVWWLNVDASWWIHSRNPLRKERRKTAIKSIERGFLWPLHCRSCRFTDAKQLILPWHIGCLLHKLRIALQYLVRLGNSHSSTVLIDIRVLAQSAEGRNIT